MQHSTRILFVFVTLFGLASAGGCASHAPRPAVDPVAVSANADTGDETRKEVVKSVRALVGAPYRYGGNSPRGFDCSGLVWYVHHEVGIRVPRTASQQFRASAHKDSKHLKPGDLLFFANSKGRIFHVGTYVGRGRFVHAPSAGKAVITSKLNEPFWKTHLAGVGSFY